MLFPQKLNIQSIDFEAFKMNGMLIILCLRICIHPKKNAGTFFSWRFNNNNLQTFA